MKQDYSALFGPLAALLLTAGIFALPFMVPGYDSVRQTVSEIGEVGSPAQFPFTLLLCAAALGFLVFAIALWRAANRAGRSALPAFLTACMAISGAGVGIFSFPHPLHNVFGMSELIGYQAPLALALTWRNDPDAKALVRASWLMFALMSVAIVLNLSVLDRHGALFLAEKPYYGLVQRMLFAVWCGWVAIIGLLLFNGRAAQPAWRAA
jgi:hypothetical membrane protein